MITTDILMATPLIIIAGICFAVFTFITLLFMASCYKRCPSNKILAIYGRVGSGESVKCYHGGGSFIWPLIQGYAYLDLTPMTINIPLKSALSQQNIRIDVPSTFTVAVSTDPTVMNNAAIRLLNLTHKEIESMASEIIFGQLRLTIASLTIEQINQDRERFFESIRNNIEPELHKIGLELINVNITDIHDESGYIKSIGKKAASSAINQAKIDVAEQEKHGAIGAASAEREQRIAVADYHAQAVAGENKSNAEIASHNADLAEKRATAQQRSQIAEQNAQVEIQTSRAQAERKRLEAEQVVKQDIERQRVEIEAQAAANKQRIEAIGQADSILAVQTAEAEGIAKILQAKSDGYKQLLASCDNDAKQAATLLLVEKLEEIVRLQTEAIKNIKIDKVTVWDSANGKDGSSTANFLSGMVKSLPALHDVAQMAGVELPEYLGSIKSSKKDS